MTTKIENKIIDDYPTRNDLTRQQAYDVIHNSSASAAISDLDPYERRRLEERAGALGAGGVRFLSDSDLERYVSAASGEGEEGSVEATPEELAMYRAAAEYSKRATQIMEENFKRGTDIYNRYLEEFQPGEKSFARALFAGVDPQQAVNAAVSDIAQQYNVARGIKQRQSARVGILPGSGRYEAMDRADQITEAAARAGAATMARRDVQAANEVRKMQAVNLGRGLLPISASFTGTGLQAGQSAVGALAGPAELSANREARNAQAELQRQQMLLQTMQMAESARQAKSAEKASTTNAFISALGTLGGAAVGTMFGNPMAGAALGGSLASAGTGAFATPQQSASYMSGTTGYSPGVLSGGMSPYQPGSYNSLAAQYNAL